MIAITTPNSETVPNWRIGAAFGNTGKRDAARNREKLIARILIYFHGWKASQACENPIAPFTYERRFRREPGERAPAENGGLRVGERAK